MQHQLYTTQVDSKYDCVVSEENVFGEAQTHKCVRVIVHAVTEIENLQLLVTFVTGNFVCF